MSMDNVKGIPFAVRWSLQGQTALVTGGTRGIGRAIVEELASLGAIVYTCARSEQDLISCLKQWEAAGFTVKGSTCDVSSREQREALFRDVSSAFHGKLNILVNNVGTYLHKPTVEYTAEDISSIFSTNLESAYHNSQLAHPLLKASGQGSLVFVSSVAGVVAVLPAGSVYGMSKGAMNQLTKNLACEWAKDAIRVNAVAPWFIETDLIQEMIEDKEFTKQVIGRTPLQRLGKTYEIASVAAFLCLPAAGYVSGQVIIVDGATSVNGLSPT